MSRCAEILAGNCILVVLFTSIKLFAISDADWGAMGSIAGVNYEVSAVTSFNGTLYVAGSFKYAGTSSAGFIAKWDGTGWSALGSGVNSIVFALAVDRKGNLYAGGWFDSAGTIAVNYIAKWNGTAWSALGSGLRGGIVEALAIDKNDNVYAGGSFDTAGNDKSAGVAKWNGTTWEPLSSSIFMYANRVHALAFDPQGNLYAGGTPFVMKWNGIEWKVIGPDQHYFPEDSTISDDNCIFAITFDSSGNLYAAGKRAPYPYESQLYYFIRWDGTTWGQIGDCSNNSIHYGWQDAPRLVCDSRGNLYVGGHYRIGNGCLFGADTDPGVVKWDGKEWDTVVSFTSGKLNALYIDSEDNLYVGGSFTSTGKLASKGIVRFRNDSSYVVGNVGAGWPIADLAIDKDGVLWANRIVYIRNRNEPLETIRHDGGAWSAPKNPPYLYKGDFLVLKDTAISGISEILNRVNTLVVDKNDDIFLGGFFDSTCSLKKWNGSSWSVIEGMPKYTDTYSLCFDNKGNLFVGGEFMGIWDGNKMQSIPFPKVFQGSPGILGTILCYDSLHEVMYANASFSLWNGIDSKPYNFVFAKDSTSWVPLGDMIYGDVRAMLCDRDGNLYIGGTFDSIGSVECNNLAKWDGDEWTAMGSGTDKGFLRSDDGNKGVTSLALRDSLLYVGGAFFKAGNRISPYIANVNIRGTGNAPVKKSHDEKPAVDVIRYRLTGSALSISNIGPTDRIFLHTLSGRCVRDVRGVSVVKLNKITRQLMVIRVLRGSRVISEGMVMVP